MRQACCNSASAAVCGDNSAVVKWSAAVGFRFVDEFQGNWIAACTSCCSQGFDRCHKRDLYSHAGCEACVRQVQDQQPPANLGVAEAVLGDFLDSVREGYEGWCGRGGRGHGFLQGIVG